MVLHHQAPKLAVCSQISRHLTHIYRVHVARVKLFGLMSYLDQYSLAAVNFCLFLVGTVQVSRILLYQQSIKGTEGAIKSLEQDIVDSAKSVEKKIEQKL